MQLQLQASPVLQHCRRKARRCNQGEEPISVSLRSRLFHREAMGNHVSREDFEWTKQEQPHNKRRTEILKKYPQIKKLFGVDPTFKWKVVFLVLMQFMMVRLLSTSSWTVVVFAAYAIGGTINHALVLAEHEIAHHAAFGIQRPVANRLFGIFTNLPIGLPLSVAFKRYHRDHHRHLGEDTMDPDLPTRLEAKVFCTTFGKLLWIIVQPIFYVIRPLIVNPKVPENMEYVNAAIQVSFNCLVCYCFGSKMLFYLIGGSILGMGLHPVSGHFISEHYIFKKGQETCSYYGPLNMITFNVGYHNEHHDFPYIPGSRLPEVRQIAPEYYDALPSHDSWVRVIFDFVFDADLGAYARIKRAKIQ